MKHFLLVISVIFYFSNVLSVNANDSAITENLIIEKNNDMAQTLKQKNASETIEFLHTHINDDAIFEIEVNNPTLPANVGTQSFKMDKTAYINSFVKGLHYIDQYNVTINTVDIQISANNKSAIVSEVMVEEGVILDAGKPTQSGLPFSTTTKCLTTYIINNGLMKSDKATCKTAVAEINTI